MMKSTSSVCPAAAALTIITNATSEATVTDKKRLMIQPPFAGYLDNTDLFSNENNQCSLKPCSSISGNESKGTSTG